MQDLKINATIHYLEILNANSSYMQKEMRDSIEHAIKILYRLKYLGANMEQLIKFAFELGSEKE